MNSRQVVVKVLLEETLGNSWAVNKFRHEIEALTRLDHPSIVGILDAGELDGGQPFIVMQYVEGVNLRRVMTVEGLNLARVGHLVRQIGRALSAAHDKGICHRDLKPENVMLQTLSETEEQVKVIDFGIAKVKDSLMAPSTGTELLVGTVVYMSPEQLEKRPVTAASDIYTLGAMAYEMVAGRRPFNPESAFQLLEMQRAGVRVRPKDLRPSLPEAAQEAILRALSFDPQQRYRRARDFGDELARALSNEAAPLPPPVAAGTTVVTPSRPSAASTTEQPLAATKAMRIALLYKRHAQPDEHLLKVLESELLAQGCEVFIDRHLSIGVEWAQEIERQVRSADAVIPLLSEASVGSEMLTYEVQTAHDAAQKQKGKPRLLPVRINYEKKKLPDVLAAILDPLQYAAWNDPQDDKRLAAELLNSLRNPPSQAVDLRKLEQVGGAMSLDSKLYIVRPTDEEFLLVGGIHRTATQARRRIRRFLGRARAGRPVAKVDACRQGNRLAALHRAGRDLY